MLSEKVFSKILRFIVIAVLIVGALAGFGFYMEYLKVAEIGNQYVSVFVIGLLARLMAGVGLFFAAFLIAVVNGAFLRRFAKSRGELAWIMKRKFVYGAGAVLGLLMALSASTGLGEKFLLFKNAVPYGETDPLFGKDISYFFFKRDFYISCADILVFVLILLLIYTAFSYFVMYFSGDRRETLSALIHDRCIFGHCAFIALTVGAVKALTYRFTAEGLVYSNTAGVTGGGYTDVKIRLPFFTAAPYIICVLLAVGLFFLFKGKVKGVLFSIAAFPVLLAVVSISAAFTESFIVKPNEVAMEKPYIDSNIKYTKMGFGLNDVEVRTFPVDNSLTAEDIKNNAETVNNIRVTDLPATLSVSNSTKSVRDYYTFTDSDIVTYDVNGQIAAINISPRELDADKLPEGSKNYINLHLRYTHGFGLVANTINEVTSDGQPVYVIDRMPVESAEGYPKVTQPRIYYGEMTDNYVVVNTDYDELDYVTEEELTGKIYNADSGIKMNGLNRLLFSIDELDYKLLVSGYINADSRLLINRNIFRRVKKAVPFLVQDDDPYILIDENGALKWVLDLYTTSDKMPYAQSYSGCNYIRNSAKAVIDAYSGDVDIYITDESDPIIMTYKSIYPKAFSSEPFPADLAAHIRCPEALFELQYNVYLRYHMDNTANFYGNSDLWMTPKEKYMNNETVDIEPYYNLMQLKSFGDENAELVLMKPFAPANKENLVGWLASTANGKMMLYKFPTGKTVYGTLHIENRIDSNDEISKEISLWDQGGSSVIKGNLLVIPIENSLLYVEPIYLTTANNAALPEIKRVVVSYGEKLVMEPSLQSALDKLFDKNINDENENSHVTPNNDISGIAEAYENAEKARKNGDWTQFGRAMDELGRAIYSKYLNEGDANE